MPRQMPQFCRGILIIWYLFYCLLDLIMSISDTFGLR